MNASVTLQFLGAAGTVTGSKYLVCSSEARFVVDAGMYQGAKELRLRNREPFAVDPATIDFVLLTHAHADHTAHLPSLVKQGFTGPIWCTEGTARLTEIVLRDSAHLQELATEHAIRGGYSKHAEPKPIYDTADVERTLPLFRTVGYDTDTDVGHGVRARWTRAGHILGSASVWVEVEGTSIVFSGDLGPDDHPIIRRRETPPGARWVLCESTYGDREHEHPAVAHDAMAKAIKRTIARGGTVVIPAFAIDRTQSVLDALVEMRREGRIPDVPVIVDGPMSMRTLDVYKDMPEEFADGVTVGDFMGLPHLIEARTTQDSRKAQSGTGPKVVISSSGMLEGGRVLGWLTKLLPDAKNTVILSGYQGEGTRGRALLDGARYLKINGRHVPVRAELVNDREFSAHADLTELLHWVGSLNPAPELVYVVHGEPASANALAERIEQELGIGAVVGRHNEKVLLTDPAPEEEQED